MACCERILECFGIKLPDDDMEEEREPLINEGGTMYDAMNIDTNERDVANEPLPNISTVYKFPDASGNPATTLSDDNILALDMKELNTMAYDVVNILGNISRETAEPLIVQFNYDNT